MSAEISTIICNYIIQELRHVVFTLCYLIIKDQLRKTYTAIEWNLSTVLQIFMKMTIKSTTCKIVHQIKVHCIQLGWPLESYQIVYFSHEKQFIGWYYLLFLNNYIARHGWTLNNGNHRLHLNWSQEIYV